ncbi:DUF3244 domain-containing protein [uncultured Bacteroides sp.]|uniref:DUF3244 domain-containing protein n=1 Tax=uncultured Bacteroides sp. TaxID=162156 RepID=UPI0025E0B783|nr:DUF3244 domain-containing protein [uncultured Bacteroides sp.]
MRTTIITIILLLSLPAYSISRKKIELQGEYERAKTRMPSIPPKASFDENSISVEFYNSITNATITIISPDGKIEKRTLSSANFQTERFEIDEYSQGMYSITITTPNGTNLYGTFYIE